MTPNLPAGGQPPPASTAALARSKRAQRAPRPGSRQVRPSGTTAGTGQPPQPPAAVPGSAPAARPTRARRRCGSGSARRRPCSRSSLACSGSSQGNSIVVVGTESPGRAVRVTLRYDVPDPRRPAAAAALAGHAVSVLAAQGVTTAVAVGYGSDAAVSPVAAALRERAAEAGVTLTEVLRAEGQRYWSYVCADPACCPPEGTPYDVTGHPAARALAAAGGQVLAGREELSASLAPAGGQLGAAMRRATIQGPRAGRPVRGPPRPGTGCRSPRRGSPAHSDRWRCATPSAATATVSRSARSTRPG